MRKFAQTTAILLFILLTVDIAWGAFALSAKVRTRVTADVTRYTQRATGFTTVQTIFADQSLASCDRVLISVDNTSANYLTDLNVYLTDDNNNYTDAFEVIAALSTGVFAINGYSNCSATLAAGAKCYVMLPSNSGFTNVDLTAAATTVADVTTKLTCWR